MCTHLNLQAGSPQSWYDIGVPTRQAVQTWASDRIKQGENHAKWEAVKSYPFGGFRRAENLESTAKKEAVLNEDGRPIRFNVPISGYTEGGRQFEVHGSVEFRLHNAWDGRDGRYRKAWMLVTVAGKHGLADRRGNCRAPLVHGSHPSVLSEAAPASGVGAQRMLPF